MVQQPTPLPAAAIISSNTTNFSRATTPPAVVRIGVAVKRHAGGGQTVRAIA
jgi:hypothetical protein